MRGGCLIRSWRWLGALGVLLVSAVGASPVAAADVFAAAGPQPLEAGAEVESTPLGLPAAALPPADAASAGEPGSSINLGEALRTLLSLAVVLGLAVGGAAVLKAVAKGRGGLLGALGPGGPSPSGVLDILGRYPVGSGQVLILLRLDRRVVLLHQTLGRRGGQMRTLAEITDAEEVASILMKTREEETRRVESGFREAMRRLESDFSGFERESHPGPTSAGVWPGEVVGATGVSAAGSAETSAGDSPRSRLSRWAAGGVA